jgi:hypothetical protein
VRKEANWLRGGERERGAKGGARRREEEGGGNEDQANYEVMERARTTKNGNFEISTALVESG